MCVWQATLPLQVCGAILHFSIFFADDNKSRCAIWFVKKCSIIHRAIMKQDRLFPIGENENLKMRKKGAAWVDGCGGERGGGSR